VVALSAVGSFWLKGIATAADSSRLKDVTWHREPGSVSRNRYV